VTAPERRVKVRTFTVQSMRLDAVAAGLFGLSRTTAAALIHAGAASLNHLPCLHTDAPIREGDVISIRGHGKATVAELSGQSRKGRTFLQYYSYDYPCAALGNAAHQSQSTRLAYGNATRRFFGQRGYHCNDLKKPFPAP